MRRYYMKQKLKSAAAFLIILILLPYVVSVFVNGTDTEASRRQENSFVRVNTADAEGNVQTVEIGWTEYLAGMLAAEMQKDSGTEAMKAQAVLIRTNIYRELSGGEDKTLDSGYLTREEMEEKWGAAEAQKQYERCIRAVEETDNIVLWYQDAYPWLPFHQSSSGMTRSAEEVLNSQEYPYLAVKYFPLDK